LNFYHYSNGKLLLTGEYFILFGAKALAMPVKYGQEIKVSSGEKQGVLTWTAESPDGVWFRAEIKVPQLEVLTTDSEQKAYFLMNLLFAAREINSTFLSSDVALNVHTTTNFPIEWGLGTSSTLINNIAHWATIDPFLLHHAVSRGSGYDVACADRKEAFIYELKESANFSASDAELNWPFRKQLYFVYSGAKKHTEQHLSSFFNHSQIQFKELAEISKITESVAKERSLGNFIEKIQRHEYIVAKLLNTQPVKTRRFSDFQGAVKSLGAWGGDFMLIATHLETPYVRKYFEQFNLSVIIPFEDMLIS
jgi:mevalonate kinase